MAKRNFQVEMAQLEGELAALKAQRRAIENKVSLLQATRLDPDLLDEEGRRQLDFVNAKDLVLLKPRS
jgi:cell division protein FtsB